MLERAIEATLFLAPFLAYFAWRFVLSGWMPPSWLLTSGLVLAALLLAALAWVHQQDQENARRSYVPAVLQHGEVVTGHAGQPLPPPALDGHGSQD